MSEDVQTLKSLMLRGCDPNISNYDGVCALHGAAEAGLLGTVLHLIEAGADVNIKDRWHRIYDIKDRWHQYMIARTGGESSVILDRREQSLTIIIVHTYYHHLVVIM